MTLEIEEGRSGRSFLVRTGVRKGCHPFRFALGLRLIDICALVFDWHCREVWCLQVKPLVGPRVRDTLCSEAGTLARCRSWLTALGAGLIGHLAHRLGVGIGTSDRLRTGRRSLMRG